MSRIILLLNSRREGKSWWILIKQLCVCRRDSSSARPSNRSPCLFLPRALRVRQRPGGAFASFRPASKAFPSARPSTLSDRAYCQSVSRSASRISSQPRPEPSFLRADQFLSAIEFHRQSASSRRARFHSRERSRRRIACRASQRWLRRPAVLFPWSAPKVCKPSRLPRRAQESTNDRNKAVECLRAERSGADQCRGSVPERDVRVLHQRQRQNDPSRFRIRESSRHRRGLVRFSLNSNVVTALLLQGRASVAARDSCGCPDRDRPER